MINRVARDQGADLLDLYRAGRITNREFERGWPDDQGDRGLREVGQFVWTLYDDFREEVLDLDRLAGGRVAGLLSNSSEFLRTDEDYAYPYGSSIDAGYVPSWLVLISFGLFSLLNKRARTREDRYWREMRDAGDLSAWPLTGKDSREIMRTLPAPSS